MVTIRAWLTAFVVAVSLVVGTPGTQATASDGSLVVRIDALSPSQLSGDATIRMRGVIRNTGESPWTAVQAYLVIPRSPFQTREQIRTAIEDGQAYTGERVVDVGSFDEVGDLAPGASVRFDIRVPVSRLGLAGPGGVYPVGVQVLATDDEGDRSNAAVARATTFLPWVERSAPPVPAGLVWPFTPTWPVVDPDWQEVADSVTQGQLRHYLDAARTTARAARTIVLDPSLLDELRRLVDPDTRPQDAEISDDQAEAVATWLADLRELALDSTTWIVSYARPDELALNRYPENAETLWQQVDAATSAALVAHALTGSRASWPTISGTTRGMLEDIRTRGEGPTLVSRRSVPDWEPRLGSIVNLETTSGPLPLLVNGSLPDTPGVETAVTLRQRILTDAALGVLSREGDSGSRADALTIVDPSWNPGLTGGSIVSRAVTARGSAGLTRSVTAADLIRAAPSTYTGDVPEDVDTRSLSPTALDRIATLAENVTRLHEVVVEEDRQDLSRDVVENLSVRWRSEPAKLLEKVDAQLASVESQLAGISIDSPSTITLSSNRGGFPLTIANDTERTVQVGLSLDADNPSLDLGDIPAVEIDPGERHTVTVEVDLGDQTSSTVTARLATASGVGFGDSAVFNIRSSNVGLIVWITMGAAGLLVVATWARRFLGRRRRRGAAAAHAEGFEDVDE